MESVDRNLLFIIGTFLGAIIGGVVVFFIANRKRTNLPDDPLRQEYEKEKIRLQSELNHAGKTITEKSSLIADNELKIAELTTGLNQTVTNLSVANERLQFQVESNQKINTELNQKTIELSATQNSLNETLNELSVSREKTQFYTETNSALSLKTEEQTAEIIHLQNNISEISATAKSLENNLGEARRLNNLKEVQIHDLTELNSHFKSENAALSAQLSASETKLATQKEDIEDIRRKSHLEFENIANRLLETKAEKFTESNRLNIESLLEPLGREINSFKNKVEETYDREAKERFSLGEKVRELIQTTDKVSAEANNLATALKGQAKTQGNWGEMILERILETNGLMRGREYDVQHPIKNTDGDQQFLDVIVHLPDNRKLIIDSKVTLVAYDRYCASETEEDRERCLKEHLKALSTHIDQLSSKKYDDMETSPDFVMLFVPIEPAYLTAVQNDSEIWARAYAKKVLLISPTNLMAAVKMVSDLWKRDQQSKNALAIALQGEKLYDKFINFLNSMEDIGNHLNKSQDAYNRALNQLKQGRGNLVRQAEKLRDLGIKSPKALPASMINFDDEDNFLLELTEHTS